MIADPARGLVVLEVKGGRIELQGGRWLQNGKPLGRSPRQQGFDLARRLHDAIRERGAESPPYDAACALPYVPFSAPPDTGELAGLVLGARELGWLDWESAPRCSSAPWAAAVRRAVPGGSRSCTRCGATPGCRASRSPTRWSTRTPTPSSSTTSSCGCSTWRATIRAPSSAAARGPARPWWRASCVCGGPAPAGACSTCASPTRWPRSSIAPSRPHAPAIEVRAATVRRRDALDLVAGHGGAVDSASAGFWDNVSLEAAAGGAAAAGPAPDDHRGR